MQVKESGVMRKQENGETGIPMIALQCPSLIADGCLHLSVYSESRSSMKLKSQLQSFK